MSRNLEQTVSINGEIGSSFIKTFRQATDGMNDLQREAREVQRELSRLGNDFRKGKIHQSQYTEETRKLTSELNRLENKQKVIDSVKGKLSNGWNTVKNTAKVAAVGTAVAGVGAAFHSLNVAADFESQMSKVGAKTDATGEEMKALRDTALELGAKTSLSAKESAIAMDELAAGGMSVKQIIGAMPGIIAGAEASGEDLALVSQTVASALNIWKLEAEDASRVSDVLAKSANISAAGVEDFALAFKYAGNPAANLGYTIEETAAAISLMADSGIDGSAAGTSLRAALLKLANPTKKQMNLMKKYGISLKDSQGNAKSLPKLVGEIEKAFKGMSDVDVTASLGTLVGTEAVSGFMTLMSAGERQLADYTKQLEDSAGSSAKAAAVMKDNFSGAKEQMMGALETAQIAAATPSLDVFKRTFEGIASMIENNIPAIEQAGQSVANALEDILAPFTYYNEPIKPEFEPFMDPDYIDLAMKDYQTAMEKYDLFSNMSVGDKVDYMLDETINKMSSWVQGEGGAKIQSLFTEIATVAAGAWSTTFTAMVKGSFNELKEGNFGSAIGMAGAANAMTGGLLMSGALLGGKLLLGKGKGLFKGKGGAKSVAQTTTPTISQKAVPANATTVKKPANYKLQKTTGPLNGSSSQLSSVIPTTSKKSPTIMNTTSKASKLNGATKVLGKAAAPIAVGAGVYNIATSDNKSGAVGGLGGTLAGGAAGTKMGAAIGTAIAPGLGTAIGAAVGGLGGSIVGSGVGSKIGSTVGGWFGVGKKTKAVADTQQVSTQTAASTSTIDTSSAQSSLSAITTASDSVVNNLNTLANNITVASAGIEAISKIGNAADRVVASLFALEQRINTTTINSNGKPVGGRLDYA